MAAQVLHLQLQDHPSPEQAVVEVVHIIVIRLVLGVLAVEVMVEAKTLTDQMEL
jgi:hypothetical protein